MKTSGATEAAERRGLDIEMHVPALSNRLASKLGLHAARHGAKRLGLDLREWRLVMVLGSLGRSTVLELAEQTAMDRGGTSRAVARLEGRDIVRRETDPADRRKSLIVLTDRGWELSERIARFAELREERLLESLTAVERRQLRRLLSLLVERADRLLADGWAP